MITVEQFYREKGKLPDMSETELPAARVDFYSSGVMISILDEQKGEMVSKWTTYQEFLKQIAKVKIPVMVIDPEIRVVGTRVIGAVMPACKRVLKYLETTKSRKVTAYLPHILVIGLRDTNRYHMFAVEDKEVHENMLLYHLPLPNIYSAGNPCFGNTINEVPKAKDYKTLKAAYELFFGNYFTAEIPKEFRKKETMEEAIFSQKPVGELVQVLSELDKT